MAPACFPGRLNVDNVELLLGGAQDEWTSGRKVTAYKTPLLLNTHIQEARGFFFFLIPEVTTENKQVNKTRQKEAAGS